MFSYLPRGLKTPPELAADPPFQPARAVAGRIAGAIPGIPVSSRLQEKGMLDHLHSPGRTSIHERKLAAWALFVGERRRVVSSPDRSARPHRGMLPDIDPAIAAPDPNGRSMLRRLFDFVRDMAGPVEALEIAPAWSQSGAREAPVGKTTALSYIGKEKLVHAGDRASATQAPDFDHSRAA